MNNIVQHTIADNELVIENKKYTGLDIDKVIVGVENSERQEIVKNEETGLNYSRNAVEGQEIYNYSTQHHGNWFILDLETGSRGWYPGCVIHGDIESAILYAEADESSEQLETIETASVQVCNIDALTDEPYTPGWYEIKYDKTGYVKKSAVSNLRYEDPF